MQNLNQDNDRKTALESPIIVHTRHVHVRYNYSIVLQGEEQ